MHTCTTHTHTASIGDLCVSVEILQTIRGVPAQPKIGKKQEESEEAEEKVNRNEKKQKHHNFLYLMAHSLFHNTSNQRQPNNSNKSRLSVVFFR